MNAYLSFGFEVILTLLACGLGVLVLRRYLKQILVDLCGTETRAEFWTVFSTLLLTSLPLVIALGFRPETRSFPDAFFELMGRISGNLGGFLTALIAIGLMVSFFSLVAPRQNRSEGK